MLRRAERPDENRVRNRITATARAGPGGIAAAGFDEPLHAVDDAARYLTLEEMLSQLLERIRGELAVDTAVVLLMDDDRRMLVARAARGLEEEVRQGVQVPLAHGFAGRIASQAEPIVIEDLSTAQVVNPILREKGIHSLLGVPILADGRVIGVMHVGSMTLRRFGEDEVCALQLAADTAAAAIDQARAAEQRAVTEIFQRTLMPGALPEISDLRLSAKYLPAGSGVRLGGDWYDVFQLDDGRVTFVIGDVVGRGVRAATIMAEMRTAVRAYRTEGHELDEVVRLLNDLLTSVGRSHSATVAVIELDLEKGELTAVSAGHLPALMITREGEPRFIAYAQQGPVGLHHGQRYSIQRSPFEPGSALLLYTDGLVERRQESIDVGLERLQSAALEATSEDRAWGRSVVGRLADRVYRRLAEQTSVDDDIALLAVESLPLGPTMEIVVPATASALPEVRRGVARWVAGQGADDDERFDVALATSEAVSNAIEHAYGASEDTLAVTGEWTGDTVRVTVRDTGSWRDARPQDRGRGLTIMRRLMDTVELTTGPDGTTVTLAKRLSAGMK